MRSRSTHSGHSLRCNIPANLTGRHNASQLPQSAMSGRSPHCSIQTALTCGTAGSQLRLSTHCRHVEHSCKSPLSGARSRQGSRRAGSSALHRDAGGGAGTTRRRPRAFNASPRDTGGDGCAAAAPGRPACSVVDSRDSSPLEPGRQEKSGTSPLVCRPHPDAWLYFLEPGESLCSRCEWPWSRS